MKLHVQRLGEGPALVILHGLLGSSDNWITLARGWSQSFTVLLMDQRNHGRSPHTPGMTYEEMAQDVYETLQAEGVTRANLIGHSMGGKTTMTFSAMFPNVLEKMIVVDMVPGPIHGGHEVILQALLSMPASSISSRQEANERLKNQGIGPEAVRQFLLKNLVRNDVGGFRWRPNIQALHENYPLISAGLPQEVGSSHSALFIRGGQSDYIGEGDEPLIIKRWPRSKVVTIPGAGHWVHAAKPRELAEIVKNFMHNEQQ